MFPSSSKESIHTVAYTQTYTHTYIQTHTLTDTYTHIHLFYLEMDSKER